MESPHPISDNPKQDPTIGRPLLFIHDSGHVISSATADQPGFGHDETGFVSDQGGKDGCRPLLVMLDWRSAAAGRLLT